MPRIAAAFAALLTAVTCIGFNTVRYPAVWDMAAVGEGGPRLHSPEQSEAALPSVVASLSASASRPASPAQSSPAPEPSEAAPADWDPPETAAWEPSEARPIPVYSSDGDEARAPGWSEDAPIATAEDTATDWSETNAEQDDFSDHGADAREYRASPPAGEPIEAAPSAKYASSRLEQGDSPSAPVEEPTDAAGADEPGPQATLVPVEPAVDAEAGWPTTEAEPPSRWSAEADSASPSRAGDPDDSPSAGPVRRLPPVDQVFTIPAAENRPPRPNQSVPIYPTTGVR